MGIRDFIKALATNPDADTDKEVEKFLSANPIAIEAKLVEKREVVEKIKINKTKGKAKNLETIEPKESKEPEER